MKPPRSTIKTPGDMARRAASFFKAGRTLLLEGRDSYWWLSREHQLANFVQADALAVIERALVLASRFDKSDASRRAKQARKAKRAA